MVVTRQCRSPNRYEERRTRVSAPHELKPGEQECSPYTGFLCRKSESFLQHAGTHQQHQNLIVGDAGTFVHGVQAIQ